MLSGVRGTLSTMNIKSIGFVTAVGAAAVAIGTGIAAAQPDDGEGTPITGDALTKASQAALAFTGGGTVTGTEVGDEESLLRGRGDAGRRQPGRCPARRRLRGGR